jgi:glycosyltransferase involved in cell wall biosynthesis
MRNNPKVLIVATSRKTRGGITSVIKAHEQGEHWGKFHCRWVETHIDKGVGLKLFYALKSLIQFFFLVPFYDLVHIHVSTYPSLRRKYLFFFLSKLFRKKIISHFHPASPDVLFEKKHQAYYRRFFKGCDRVVVLSRQWQLWMKETLGITDNVQYIYNPCPTVENITINKRKNYILYAGTVNKRKGYDILIRSFAKVAKSFPDWKVIFAGNGEIEEGKRLAKELNIEKQIIFKGWVSGDAKDKLFRESAIYCLASSGEGFPMAVLDAWAYGLPVVCTPVGGLPDVLEDGKNALVYDYGDEKKLATHFERLIQDKTLRKEIAKESINLSNTVFNINTINKEVEKLYEEMLLPAS